MSQVANIFQPRKAYKVVDEKKGVVEQVDYVTPVLIKEFDKYYIKRQIKFVPVPVAENSDDYVLDMKVIDDKEDIVEVINSQAENVGLEAMIKKYERTGDPSVLPQPLKATDEVVDFTQLPQDNAEYFDYIHALAEKYESLPIELRKDMTATDFIRNVTDKQVNDYLASIKPQEEKKDE